MLRCVNRDTFTFYCVSTAGIISRQGTGAHFLFERDIDNRWPGPVMLLPQQYAENIAGAREVRLKLKKKSFHP